MERGGEGGGDEKRRKDKNSRKRREDEEWTDGKMRRGWEGEEHRKRR